MSGSISAKEWNAIIVIYISCIIAIVWGIYNAYCVLSINVTDQALGDKDAKLKERNVRALVDIGGKISRGANAFLKAEYTVMSAFVVVFSVIVFVLVDYLG